MTAQHSLGERSGHAHLAGWSGTREVRGDKTLGHAGTQLKVIQLKLMKEADPSLCLTARLLKLCFAFITHQGSGKVEEVD